MSSTPNRQQAAFPEVAYIRKGTPKRKKDGQEILGRDLKTKFRIHFLSGTETTRQAFHKWHAKEYVEYGPEYVVRDGYEVKELRAMIPFADAYKGWTWGNEAYNSGRRIAKADDDFYIEKRDPLTGEHIIRNGVSVVNGEPLRFVVGDVIHYERKGKKYSIPVRFYGNLRLFLPEVDQMVMFTLKTTSFYDRTTIEANLGAMQEIANLLNNGQSGGIPFWMYRAEKDVAWNHKDGSASRTKIWSVFLRVDEDWVKAAMRRMRQFALTGQANAGLLERLDNVDQLVDQPIAELTGTVDPNAEVFEDDDSIIDGQFKPPAEDPEPVTNAPKNERYKPTGPVGWLIEVHKLKTSDAASIANKLKLTNPRMTRNEWAQRFSNYQSLLDSGMSDEDAVKQAIQTKESA